MRWKEEQTGSRACCGGSKSISNGGEPRSKPASKRLKQIVDALWAEAVEREELLAETIEGEESRRRSAGEICQEQKAVFVVHSRETREALEGLSGESVRLVRMVPAEGASARSVGLEGSWLIFE